MSHEVPGLMTQLIDALNTGRCQISYPCTHRQRHDIGARCLPLDNANARHVCVSPLCYYQSTVTLDLVGAHSTSFILYERDGRVIDAFVLASRSPSPASAATFTSCVEDFSKLWIVEVLTGVIDSYMPVMIHHSACSD